MTDCLRRLYLEPVVEKSLRGCITPAFESASSFSCVDAPTLERTQQNLNRCRNLRSRKRFDETRKWQSS
ncbi:hypothetical protein C474_16799 [Halogeometricum pallidum JCM 14848]|uniref:Uncharacterized protein n=1 Tax=Halogeometricum pallidum JCM 14848 TaxID=1227487 RepID=M0CWN3_HALPD|nr:hypothetical protein C474_16799 [Halogeometricum pallidum JCM 14848]